MQTRLLTRYSEEQKAQVVKECIETNNYAAVSSKHDIPVTTIYGWIRRHKNKQKKESRKNVKNLCDSLGVFLNLIGDIIQYDDGDDRPIQF